MAAAMIRSGTTVLLVEDDPGSAYLIQDMLAEAAGDRIRVEHAATRTLCQVLLSERRFDVVLLDLGLPESMGLATLQYLAERFPRQPFVVLTGLWDEDAAAEALRMGAIGYLVKGRFEEPQLVDTIVAAAAPRLPELSYNKGVAQK